VKDIKVLVTGAGAPGIKGTIYSLVKNPDHRKIRIIGVDMKSDVVGKYLCDRFYRVSRGNDSRFIGEVLDICEKEHIDAVLPQVNDELLPFARNKALFSAAGTAVAVSDERALLNADDKYNLLTVARDIGVAYPEFRLASTWNELLDAGKSMGFPFVVKPPVSCGMRGFRVVYDTIDLKKAFYEEKPDDSRITIDELHYILGDRFPPLLVTEYLPGREYSVDVLSRDRKVLAVVPRSRDLIRTGITFNGTVVKDDRLIDYSRMLTESIGLDYAHGFQFKGDRDGNPKLLESNPRVQGTMALSTVAGANIIYSAVKLALGEKVPEMEISWGARLYRYWGGIGVGKSQVEL